MKRLVATFIAALLLTACGGGGGGKSKAAPTPSAPPPPAPPAATVTLTLTSPQIDQTLDYGDDFDTSLNGTWSGNNLGNAVVYLQVTDNGNLFIVPAAQSASGGTFQFTLRLPSNAQAGNRTGTLTVKACKDTACNQPYSGSSSAAVNYRLQINAVGEWETFQRDATHAAYVPIRLDPARFAKAWEWTFPQDAAATSAGVSRPVTGPGTMFAIGSSAAADGTRYAQQLVALDEYTGAQKWNRALPDQPNAKVPSTSNGFVYLPTANSDTLITAYDATTGAQRFKYVETTLADVAMFAPTPFGGDIYFFAGSAGQQVHGMNGSTGERRWAKARNGALSVATPAVDQNFMYYHSGSAVELVDRQTGNSVAAIPDPFSDGTIALGSRAPMLGSRGNLIVVSYIQRSSKSNKLSSFNIANRQWEWSSEYSYLNLPALAGGVIYAVRQTAGSINSPMTLDALDEATGDILWSWAPPAEDQQPLMLSNVVVTKNLVFVGTWGPNSTDPGYVWAIDRDSHQVAWRYPERASSIVISANRTMYVVTSPEYNRIVAIKLR